MWISLLFVIASSKASLWLTLIIPFNFPLYYRNHQRLRGYMKNRNKMNFEVAYTPMIAGQIIVQLKLEMPYPYPEGAFTADMVNYLRIHENVFILIFYYIQISFPWLPAPLSTTLTSQNYMRHYFRPLQVAEAFGNCTQCVSLCVSLCVTLCVCLCVCLRVRVRKLIYMWSS